MKLYDKRSPLPVSQAPLRNALLACVTAALCWTNAGAADYTVTTHTKGSAGSFLLPQLFPEGDVSGTDTYELTITSKFSSDDVTSSVDQYWMQADGAALDVTLRFGSQFYNLKGTGTVSSTIRTDTDGDGQTVKRFYNSISFDPSPSGTFATFDQYLFLNSDQFAINSVLEPATGYYADPLVKGFSVYHYQLNPGDPRSLLGDGAGRADTFEYNLALAVPEPGTWAMLGAGLGIVGFAGRRRRALPA